MGKIGVSGDLCIGTVVLEPVTWPSCFSCWHLSGLINLAASSMLKQSLDPQPLLPVLSTLTSSSSPAYLVEHSFSALR